MANLRFLPYPPSTFEYIKFASVSCPPNLPLFLIFSVNFRSSESQMAYCPLINRYFHLDIPRFLYIFIFTLPNNYLWATNPEFRRRHTFLVVINVIRLFVRFIRKFWDPAKEIIMHNIFVYVNYFDTNSFILLVLIYMSFFTWICIHGCLFILAQ